jgi:hypothetical protein
MINIKANALNNNNKDNCPRELFIIDLSTSFYHWSIFDLFTFFCFCSYIFFEMGNQQMHPRELFMYQATDLNGSKNK